MMKFIRRRRKKSSGVPKSAERKLEEVTQLKQQIIAYFYQGKLRRFNTRLGFLKENQADKPELLAKSLSDIAKNICDNEIKLALFGEDLELNPDETVTLTSYGTALANHNQAEKAFEQFETSLQIKPDETVTLTSYGMALAKYNYRKNAFEKFEAALKIDPNNPVALFLYTTVLDVIDKNQYEKAISNIEKMRTLSDLPKYYLGFLAIVLGRLYYLTWREKEGNQCFDSVIKNAKNANIARLDR